MAESESVVWITGASSGIGSAIAHEFIENGKIVAASARRKGVLESVRSELQQSEGFFEVYPLDVKDASNVQNTLTAITMKYSIDCLINAAGITTFTPAIEDSTEDISNIISTNLLGSIYTIKAVIPHMIENKRGTIINILSVAAKKIFTNSSAYSASKAGLEAYTKVLREEVREYNIRIINIFPGATKTPIWPNESLEKFSGRMMSPNDIAKLVYELYTIKSNLVPEEIVIRPIKGDL